MRKSALYSMARHLKIRGIPVEDWPVFIRQPDLYDKEATEKSIMRHRRKVLKGTKEGRQEIMMEKMLFRIFRDMA